MITFKTVSVAALALSIGVFGIATARHQEDVSSYSSVYQQNVSKATEGWLSIGVATDWPGWGRTDTIIANRANGMTGPDQELALAVGKDFITAREKSGYSGAKATRCYVDVRDALGNTSSVYRMKQAGGVLVAKELNPSDVPWKK